MTHFKGDDATEKKEEALDVCMDGLEDEDTHLSSCLLLPFSSLNQASDSYTLSLPSHPLSLSTIPRSPTRPPRETAQDPSQRMPSMRRRAKDMRDRHPGRQADPKARARERRRGRPDGGGFESRKVSEHVERSPREDGGRRGRGKEDDVGCEECLGGEGWDVGRGRAVGVRAVGSEGLERVSFFSLVDSLFPSTSAD
jgi:hypothetical protein